MALSDDVFAFYDLESDMSDSHTGGYTFAEQNGPTYSAGKVGSAVDLDGSVNNIHGSQTSSAFSVGDVDQYYSYWFYWVDEGAAYSFDTVIVDWAAWWMHIERFGAGAVRPRTRFRSSGNVDAMWGSNLNASTWYNVFSYHDAAGNEVGISVDNGTRVTTAHSGGVDSGGTSIYLGVFSSAAHEFSGSLDSVGIFHGAPNTTRQADLYNSGTGVAYSDFSGGGVTGHPHFYRPLCLDGTQFRTHEVEVEKVRRRLESAGLGKRHMTPRHFGLRWDASRGCLWAPAREILLPRGCEVEGLRRSA